MAERLVNVDRSTPMLLPPDMREWLPADHIAHFIIDALESLETSSAKVNQRGTGNEQYPPRLMLGLLLYGYVTGRFSSREIERATHGDVAMRYLAADMHPDHDTICTFRRNNHALIQSAFRSVLLLAKEMKVLKVGTVSLDGTKVLANASKHKAASYQRAGEQIELIHAEVSKLLSRAEVADQQDLAEGLTIPEEIKRRQDRIAKLTEARRVIEERVKEHAVQLQEEYEQKVAARKAKKAQGKRIGGKPPQPPSGTPTGKEQFNFTDPESRIMKMGSGNRFEQCFNAQAAVDAEGSMLILGSRVTAASNDKQQLNATTASISTEVGIPQAIVCDSGFYSEKEVSQLEANGGPTVYAAVKRQKHHRGLADLDPHREPEELAPTATSQERMAHRLGTLVGKTLYRLRKQTVEPVFGIIKEAMRFRRFSLRGLEKVSLEWDLVSLAYNVKRLFVLKTARPA